jgi:hypothetical protein
MFGPYKTSVRNRHGFEMELFGFLKVSKGMVEAMRLLI